MTIRTIPRFSVPNDAMANTTGEPQCETFLPDIQLFEIAVLDGKSQIHGMGKGRCMLTAGHEGDHCIYQCEPCPNCGGYEMHGPHCLTPNAGAEDVWLVWPDVEVVDAMPDPVDGSGLYALSDIEAALDDAVSEGRNSVVVAVADLRSLVDLGRMVREWGG